VAATQDVLTGNRRERGRDTWCPVICDDRFGVSVGLAKGRRGAGAGGVGGVGKGGGRGRGGGL